MSEAAGNLRGEPLRRFKPYPAYKDSGVEWLREIPTRWWVKRADSFLRYDKLHIEPSEISDELVFHYSIPSVQETGDGVLQPPSEIDSAKLRIVGERLLVSKLNPRKGVVLIASEHDVPTICYTKFLPFAVRDVDVRWALYLFLGESTRQRLSAVVRSATRSHQRAEVSEIAKLWHGVPSLPEQRAIAAFLDREMARIDALVVSDITGFDRVYLSLALRVLDLNRCANQNAQPLITGGFVKAQLVCAPPVEEQRTIATFLDLETARIDALVTKVRDAIDRLKELRTALISAAVTGKIDVSEG